RTAGSIGGYITVEQADKVNVPAVGESLCVLLTGLTRDSNGKCPRDQSGNVAYQQGIGHMPDYCSTTNSPGGCADSFWLSATFAASAVTIDDAPSVPECQGTTSAPPADAGKSDAK